jgi:hypothetical protein
MPDDLPTMMMEILSFGGGVDSTCMLAMHLNRDKAASALGISREHLDAALPHFDAVAFADTGSEYPWTYENVKLAGEICAIAGIRFAVVRRSMWEDDETLFEFLTKHGSVPVLPGSHHTCSLKFKRTPLTNWAKETFPDGKSRWSIGFGADEGRRKATFDRREMEDDVPAKLPLMDLGMTREDNERMLKVLEWPYEVRKSACAWCPFMQIWEQKVMLTEGAEMEGQHGITMLEEAQEIERRFKEVSPNKHQAWIDGGRILLGRCNHCLNCDTKKNKAPRGSKACECGPDYNRCNITVMEHHDGHWPTWRATKSHKYDGITRGRPGEWKVDYYYDPKNPARLLTKKVCTHTNSDGKMCGVPYKDRATGKVLHKKANGFEHRYAGRRLTIDEWAKVLLD